MPTPASPRARMLLGLICVVAGGLVFALAVGWIEARPGQLRAPRWVIAAAGFMFLFCGLAMWLPQSKDSLAQALAGALLVTCFAVVGNWVAFWPGEREFGGALAAGGSVQRYAVGEWVGRAVFGVGALLLNVLLYFAWRNVVRLLRRRSAA